VRAYLPTLRYPSATVFCYWSDTLLEPPASAPSFPALASVFWLSGLVTLIFSLCGYLPQGLTLPDGGGVHVTGPSSAPSRLARAAPVLPTAASAAAYPVPFERISLVPGVICRQQRRVTPGFAARDTKRQDEKGSEAEREQSQDCCEGAVSFVERKVGIAP